MNSRARFFIIRNNIIPALLVGGMPGAVAAIAAAILWLAIKRVT